MPEDLQTGVETTQEVTTQPEVTDPNVSNEPATTDPVTTDPVAPQKITVEGLGEFTVDELKEMRQGYMRQSDYTKKTQEAARLRQEAQDALELFNYLKANPHVARQLAEAEKQGVQKPPVEIPDPVRNELNEIKSQLAVTQLDKDLELLKLKYPDFDEVAVLNYSVDNQVKDLDKAYKMMKAESFDPEAMRAQIEKELLAKIKANGIGTETIVTHNDVAEPVNHGLSAQELAMAGKLGMTPEEYAKWK